MNRFKGVSGDAAISPHPFPRCPPLALAATITTRSKTRRSFLRKMSARCLRRGVSWVRGGLKRGQVKALCLSETSNQDQLRKGHFFSPPPPSPLFPTVHLCVSLWGKPHRRFQTLLLNDRLILGSGLLRRAAQTFMFTSVSQFVLLWTDRKRRREIQWKKKNVYFFFLSLSHMTWEALKNVQIYNET